MLRNAKSRKLKAVNRAVCGLAVLAMVAFPVTVNGASTITNQGTVHYQNEAGAAMLPEVATALFGLKDNPILAVAKARNPISGPSGTTVTYNLTVTYPQLGGSCGDDSAAQNVTLTDTVPAGMTFAGANGTAIDYSIDNGISWTPMTATNYDGATGQIRVPMGTIPECTTGASSRVVRFNVTVN
jgi:hypothetical protein